GHALAGNLLKNAGLRLAHSAKSGVDYERAVLGNFEAFDSLVGHLNAVEVGTRVDDKFLFERAGAEVGGCTAWPQPDIFVGRLHGQSFRIAVNPQVNAGPDIAVDYFRIGL